MEITRETAQYVAKLSRLEIADADMDSVCRGLTSILSYMDEINRAAGRKVLEAVLYEDADPDAYCEAHNLSAQGDADAVRQVVLKVLDSTPNAVRDYLGGKKKAFQALFGGCMKELKGNGDPQVIRALLEEELSKRS